MATFRADCGFFRSGRADIAGFPQGFKRKIVAARAASWKSRFFACEASRSDLKVAYARLGSIPAGRLQLFKMARYPSGKGEVCKTFMRRFDSDPRLHLFTSSANREDHSRLTGCAPILFHLGKGNGLGCYLQFGWDSRLKDPLDCFKEC